MNRTVPALVLAITLVAWAISRVPSKSQLPEPSLPLMGTLGLGILVGGIVIGTIIYLRKRPPKS